MKFAFIEEHLTDYPLTVVCRMLEISCSGYYAWQKRPVSLRQQRHELLTARIAVVYQENRQVYGSPRISRALNANGPEVCRHTVAKIMREQNIRAKTKKKFVPQTTDSQHDYPVEKNRLDRQFDAPLPNRKWVADITYIPTDEGWLYLAGVLDLCSRKIVGWSMADHMEASLPGEALAMAIVQCCPKAGLLHHSDRGVQYASDHYRKLLDQADMEVSMSRKGDCWDNAVMESFWSTLKTELVSHQHYATRDQAKASIFGYIEVFYNRQRLHSTLGYVSPEAFEASLN